MEKVDLIEINMNVFDGSPKITGKRVSVDNILEKLACGESQQDIMDEWDLTEAEVVAAIQYSRKILYDYWDKNIKNSDMANWKL